MTQPDMDVTALWRMVIEEGIPKERRRRHLQARLPSDPRCRWCNAPFRGVGGMIMRMTGRRQSPLAPAYCNICDDFARKNPGGAEAVITMMFADVRGSTTMAEQLGATQFSQLMNRFYTAAGKVLVESDAWTDRLLGDQVIGFYLPGYAGKDHARVGIQGAEHLLRATGHADPGGPWVPLGAGVHLDRVFFGVVGGDVLSITALGDGANTAARLSSSAAAGEILVSEHTASAAGMVADGLERRELQLKGRTEPVTVRALKVEAGSPAASFKGG